MNSLYLQRRALEITKDGKRMNILCIVDRNHERFVVLLDHFKNFKGIYCGYIIENEGILIQGEEIIVLFEIKKSKVKN